MPPNTPSLSDEFVLGNLTLRNRTVLAPMTRVSAAADGTVTDQMREYYRIFAAGGFGAVITEGSYIDSAHSQTYLHQPGLARGEHADSWRPVTEAIRGEGAVAIAQLQHSGPQAQGNPHSGELRGPSAVAAKGEQLGMYRGSGPYDCPAALTIDEIADIRRSFVGAAIRAREAGFQGVEIHGANGYLIDAFHTDYLNLRTDRYGGSPLNRIRLATEIALDIRGAVGEDFVVGIRISQAKVSDATHTWSGGVEEARTIFGALADCGLDYIHTSEHHAHAPAFPAEDPRSLSALARAFAPTVTVIANGHIDTGDVAEQMLVAEQADLVAIGRAALTNRDWPSRVRDGRALEAPFTADRFGGLAVIRDDETDAGALLGAGAAVNGKGVPT